MGQFDIVWILTVSICFPCLFLLASLRGADKNGAEGICAQISFPAPLVLHFELLEHFVAGIVVEGGLSMRCSELRCGSADFLALVAG